MRKSFDGLWEAMEARRRQVGAGEVPPAHRLEEIRQAQRQSDGCPDGESLGGWVEGKLRRINTRRWMHVWRHVHLRRCRECRAEIAALAGGRPPVRPRLVTLVPLLHGVRLPSHRVKNRLVWGSSLLVVMIALFQWSSDVHDTLPMGNDRLEPPLLVDTRPERIGDSGHIGDAQAEFPIGGDSPHAQPGYPQAAQSHVDRQ
jgi:hypothetical protein